MCAYIFRESLKEFKLKALNFNHFILLLEKELIDDFHGFELDMTILFVELGLHVFNDFLRWVRRVDQFFNENYRDGHIFNDFKDFAGSEGLKLRELKQQSYIMRF